MISTVVFPLLNLAVQSDLFERELPSSVRRRFNSRLVRAMLLPQFTIRRLFALVTACAVLFTLVMLAARGLSVARSMIAVVGMMVMSFCVFASLYVLGVLADRLLPAKADERESPFAHHSRPPSYVVPKDE